MIYPKPRVENDRRGLLGFDYLNNLSVTISKVKGNYKLFTYLCIDCFHVKSFCGVLLQKKRLEIQLHKEHNLPCCNAHCKNKARYKVYLEKVVITELQLIKLVEDLNKYRERWTSSRNLTKK